MNDPARTVAVAPDGRKRPPRRRAKLERRNLALLMLVARDSVMTFFRPILKEYGLTEQQWRILRALYEDGESSIGQVAKRCHIVGPSLTGMLERMAQGGLLVKRVDDHDTRRFYVSPTKVGLAKCDEMMPRIDEAYRALEDQIGAEEIAVVYRQMDRLIAHANSRLFVESSHATTGNSPLHGADDAA